MTKFQSPLAFFQQAGKKEEIRYEKKSSISVNCPALHHAPDDIDHLSA